MNEAGNESGVSSAVRHWYEGQRAKHFETAPPPDELADMAEPL